MADTFTITRHRWMVQVARDPDLTPTGSRVTAILAFMYMNRREGCAWPSMPTLAATLGTSENAVRRALRALVDRGHLRIDSGGGRSASNRYHPIVKAEEPPQERGGLEREKPSQDRKGNGPKPYRERGGVDGGNPANAEQKTPTPAAPEPIEREPIEYEGGILPLSQWKVQARDATDLFGRFWSQYPRHVAKPAARRAWDQAIKEGHDPNVIMAGVHRYAAERDGQEERYTAYPATWLRNRRWEDDPTPPPSSASPERRPGSTAARTSPLEDASWMGGDDFGGTT